MKNKNKTRKQRFFKSTILKSGVVFVWFFFSFLFSISFRSLHASLLHDALSFSWMKRSVQINDMKEWCCSFLFYFFHFLQESTCVHVHDALSFLWMKNKNRKQQRGFKSTILKSGVVLFPFFFFPFPSGVYMCPCAWRIKFLVNEKQKQQQHKKTKRLQINDSETKTIPHNN